MTAVEFGRYLSGARERSHAGVEASLECLVACEVCASACLEEENVRELARCIRLDRDCAEACALAARVMSRGGEQVAEVCRMCARLCDACADECDRHAEHHDHCRLCAEACRRCADECRKMAA